MRNGQGNFTIFQCYGLEKITEAAAPPDKASYRELCKKFNLRMEDMIRPNEIDLLISMRRNRHHPNPILTKGNMTLYKGPFESVFGGTEPGLEFNPYVLNGLVQARKQTLSAVVKSAFVLGSDNMGNELQTYIAKEGISVKGIQDEQPKEEADVTAKTELELQAQVVHLPVNKAKKAWQDKRNFEDMATEAFGEADLKEYGPYDKRDSVSFEEVTEDAFISFMPGVFEQVFCAKLQVRQKPPNTTVQFLTAVFCAKKKLFVFIDKNRNHEECNP